VIFALLPEFQKQQLPVSHYLESCQWISQEQTSGRNFKHEVISDIIKAASHEFIRHFIFGN
jgi:hypothetical protein